MLWRLRRKSLSEDTLPAQILALSELSFEDRLNFIEYTRAKVLKRSTELDRHPFGTPFQILARDASLAMIRSRLGWLDRLHEAALAEWRDATARND